MSEKTFTISELAKYFNVSRQAVHDWTNRGELEAERHLVTGRKTIRLSSLRDFAKRRRLDISDLVKSEDNDGRETPRVATT